MSGTVRRFEDLLAWQEAREITRPIYAATRSGSFGRVAALRDQLRRAASSVMLNIAEGFGRGTDKESRLNLAHARGSAAEAQSALCVALDEGYLERGEFDTLHASLDAVSGMLTALANYLSGSRARQGCGAARSTPAASLADYLGGSRARQDGDRATRSDGMDSRPKTSDGQT